MLIIILSIKKNNKKKRCRLVKTFYARRLFCLFFANKSLQFADFGPFWKILLQQEIHLSPPTTEP